MRLGVLVSGRGSNLEAVLDAIASGALPRVRVVVVISNRSGVRALEVADRHGVATRILRRTDYPDAGARDRAIGRALTAASVQLALLAGYDQLLRAPYFATFGGRTINIHPSLLPAHGGHGMMGMTVHEAILAAGDRVTGATIHEVTPELDAGPVLAQEQVPVEANDTPASLAERVLAAEHRLLVATIRDLVAEGLPGMSSATMTAAFAIAPGDGAPQERPDTDA